MLMCAIDVDSRECKMAHSSVRVYALHEHEEIVRKLRAHACIVLFCCCCCCCPQKRKWRGGGRPAQLRSTHKSWCGQMSALAQVAQFACARFVMFALANGGLCMRVETKSLTGKEAAKSQSVDVAPIDFCRRTRAHSIEKTSRTTS